MEINHVDGPASASSLPERPEIKLEALFPRQLSAALNAAEFEGNVARFKDHYPVHGQPHQIARHLQEGLDLASERILPSTQALRALSSALSRLKES